LNFSREPTQYATLSLCLAEADFANTSDEDFFLTSHRGSSNCAVNDCWLKISRTPGRNVDNDSVLPEDATADRSYLAVAYPLVKNTDPIE